MNPAGFPLIDRYFSTILGADLAGARPGHLEVDGTPHRLGPLPSYGFIHAFYGLWLEDGRTVLSVPPAAREGVCSMLGTLDVSTLGPELAQAIAPHIDAALTQTGLSPTSRTSESLLFACNGTLVRRRRPARPGAPSCIRLRNAHLPPAPGLVLPTHCFPDGLVYGIVMDDHVVSVAYAHRTGVMEEEVADLGVETAPAYRKRGYASACVAAVTAHTTAQGGEALYGCSPANVASIATARGTGYIPYGRTLILVAPTA
jgi:GNAT superfamily N-acetyltransferase